MPAAVKYVFIDRYHRAPRVTPTSTAEAAKQLAAVMQKVKADAQQQVPGGGSNGGTTGGQGGVGRRLMSADPLFRDQWFLQKSYVFSSRAEAAWDVTEGGGWGGWGGCGRVRGWGVGGMGGPGGG